MFSKTELHMEFNYFKFVSDSDLVFSIFQKGLKEKSEKESNVEKVYMTRLYYREKALVIQYHVYFNGSDTYKIYYGKLFHNKEEFEKYKKKLDKKYYFTIDEYNLIVLFFPYDPKLKVLTHIFSDDEESYSIEHLFTSDEDKEKFKIKKIKVLGYRLERRAVLELTTNNNITIGNKKVDKFVLKLVKPNKIKSLYEKSELLEKYGLGSSVNDTLSIPKIYGYDESEGTLLMEKVDGTTLHDLVGQNLFQEGCGKAAEILKKVHSVPSEGLSKFSVMHELRNLSKQISIIENIYPSDVKLFLEAYDILENAVNQLTPITILKCIHRDFYDKQVICSKDRTTLVDFDNITSGDPALDYGNFIAHLYLRLHQSPEYAEQFLEGVQLFQDQYDADVLLLQRANWWQSASLLRLAAIYYFRPRWRTLTIHLLRKAIGCLES